MWQKAIWKGHPMRLELTRVGLLVELANHYTTRGTCIFESMCMYTWVHVNVCVFVCVCVVHVCNHYVYAREFMCIYVYVCVCVCGAYLQPLCVCSWVHVYVCVCVCVWCMFATTLPRARCDTMSIFKRCIAGLNSKLSFI